MNQEQINKQIFRRLEKLEKEVSIKISKSNPVKRNSRSGDKVGLPNLILKLRDSGFFRKPQCVADVHKKVSATYPCSIDRVDTALRRLKEKRKLRITDKTVKDKKVLAYVW